MIAVLLFSSPASMLTVKECSLIATAFWSQQNMSLPFPKGSIGCDPFCSRIPQLMAHNMADIDVRVVVANGAPFAIVQEFDSTLRYPFPVDKPNRYSLYKTVGCVICMNYIHTLTIIGTLSIHISYKCTYCNVGLPEQMTPTSWE